MMQEPSRWPGLPLRAAGLASACPFRLPFADRTPDHSLPPHLHTPPQRNIEASTPGEKRKMRRFPRRKQELGWTTTPITPGTESITAQ